MERCQSLVVLRHCAAIFVAFGSLAAQPQTSELKRDEEIVFYPTLGHQLADGTGWELEIRGCVYEPEQRRLALRLLKEALQLGNVSLSPAEEAALAERARFFMVDNERGRNIVVRVGGRDFVLPKSRPNGQFAGQVRLSAADVKAAGGDVLRLQAVLPMEDWRVFAGELALVREPALMVLSDVDDTIKVTHVTDRNAMLRSTFLEPFKPVPGMAEVYDTWAREAHVRFCYVSASPWQLYPLLAGFIRTNGLPAGAFCLKDFRWKDASLLNLFEDPERYKPAVIEPLLQRFPRTRFVLVGDSGERDPEIYAALAAKRPGQVARIFIRDVTGETANSPRYRTAFGSLPPGLWQIFRDPSEIRLELP